MDRQLREESRRRESDGEPGSPLNQRGLANRFGDSIDLREVHQVVAGV